MNERRRQRRRSFLDSVLVGSLAGYVGACTVGTVLFAALGRPAAVVPAVGGIVAWCLLRWMFD